MDDQSFAQEWDDEPQESAESVADAEASPSDEDAPETLDQTEDDASPDDESEDEIPEDPVAALRAEREARRQLQEQWNQRAEAEAQREAERKRGEREALEQKRQFDRTQAWQTYQAKKARVAQQRVHDATEIANGKYQDPALAAQYFAAMRQREDQSADAEYYGWVQRDQQAEVQSLRAERDRSAVSEYAEYVRDAYGLPHDDKKKILAYSDGTPVDPKAMPARAAELAEQRRERAALKRQATRQAREAGKADMRGRTAAGPGKGRGAPPQEITGSLAELHELFPWQGRPRRSS
jgi:hypothetical protein